MIVKCEGEATIEMDDIPLCAGASCNGDDAKEIEEYILSVIEDRNDACSVQVNIEGGRSKSQKLTQSYQTIMTQVRNHNHRDLISDACATETESIDVSTEEEGMGVCVTEQFESATWTDETVTIDFEACSGDYESACTLKGGVNY